MFREALKASALHRRRPHERVLMRAGHQPLSLVHMVVYVIMLWLISITLAISPLQNAQGDSPHNTEIQNEQEARSLEVGNRIEREMKGGETHAYRLALTAGQLLHVIVDQRGIDVV